MDFSDQVKQFSKRVISMKPNIATEEATKTSLIMPFFAMLGYDVFDPSEFSPEYIADVGIKKGEKVDYAILKDGEPTILIEAKWIGEALDKHGSQLFRYFGTTKAKFAILTNGEVYKFYTDLDEPNKMDKAPFLEIDLSNIKPFQFSELEKFKKDTFSVETIVGTASELKYSSAFQTVFAKELENPSDDFLKMFLSSVYSGVKTQAVMERFRPILKISLNDYINDLMNERIKSALNGEDRKVTDVMQPGSEGSAEENEASVTEDRNKIVTTTEELGAFFIVKMLLQEAVSPEEISYKDTVNYIGVLYQNKTTKWVCRFVLNDSRKMLIIPDANKKETRYQLTSIYDISRYKQELIDSVKRYM